MRIGVRYEWSYMTIPPNLLQFSLPWNTKVSSGSHYMSNNKKNVLVHGDALYFHTCLVLSQLTQSLVAGH